MTEPSPPPKPKFRRPLNRWGLGTLSFLQTAFLAILLLAINYLAANHFLRADLSREGNYTLSPSTTRYLKDPAVRDRPSSMKWIMAFRRTSPFYERVRAIAEEYARLSNGKIVLEVVDPPPQCRPHPRTHRRLRPAAHTRLAHHGRTLG